MTEQELVDALLNRFVEVAYQVPLERPPGGEDSPVTRALARECLRQMRWAYSLGWDSGWMEADESPAIGLTAIAPSDWLP
jgi:hypothetical protein